MKIKLTLLKLLTLFTQTFYLLPRQRRIAWGTWEPVSKARDANREQWDAPCAPSPSSVGPLPRASQGLRGLRVPRSVSSISGRSIGRSEGRVTTRVLHNCHPGRPLVAGAPRGFQVRILIWNVKDKCKLYIITHCLIRTADFIFYDMLPWYS